MSQELATNDLLFAPENITKETIKKYLCKLANDQELMMGLQICKEFKLNPLKREVYFIKYGEEPMQVVLGYEVYTKRADRTGKYAGLRTWTEGKVDDKTLKGCVEITVKGWEKPLYHEVEYVEYVQYKKDGTVNKFWKTKPKTMIKKVAISQGFKLAFPDEFAGMPPIAEEIDNNSIVDIEIYSNKSRVEQIIEASVESGPDPVKESPKEEVKDVPKEDPKTKSKSQGKKADSNHNESVSKPNAETNKDTGIKADRGNVENMLPEGHKTITGLIDNQAQGPEGEMIAVKTATVDREGKPTKKWSFLLDDKRYGTFDPVLAREIMAYVDERIMIVLEYKERKNEKGTVLNDIVSFKLAVAGKDYKL